MQHHLIGFAIPSFLRRSSKPEISHEKTTGLNRQKYNSFGKNRNMHGRIDSMPILNSSPTKTYF